MKAKELFESGNLGGAITQLSEHLRSHPVDVQSRIFLFELLCFAGDYDRARRQLDAIAAQNPSMAEGVSVYRELLGQELDRLAVGRGEKLPTFLTEPPPFAGLYVAALNRLAEGKTAEARILLGQAAEAQPPISGRINGAAFSDFSDADPILGPFLEAFAGGRYVWIPFARIKRMSITAPTRLRDLLWTQARIETTDGPTGEIFVPALYAGSFTHGDDLVKLGRSTQWNDAGGLARGCGHRMYFVDDGERPMLEVRDLLFE